MSQDIKIVYVGKKPYAFDNVAKSGKCWAGNGDVQEVTPAQAKLLLKFPDQWALADAGDNTELDKPVTTSVEGDDGEQVDVDHAAFGKALENMSKSELVALAKAKWGQKLDARRATKDLIDAIEEFARDLEPIANVG